MTHQGGKLIFQRLTFPFPSVALCSHQFTPYCTSLLPYFRPLTSLPSPNSPNDDSCAPTLRPLTLRPPSSYFGCLSPSSLHTHRHVAPLSSSPADCGAADLGGKPEGAVSGGEETGSIITHTHANTHFKDTPELT